MENAVNNRQYFNWDNKTMKSIAEVGGVRFHFFSNGKYSREKNKNIKKSLKYVRVYQGFVEKGEIFISKLLTF